MIFQISRWSWLSETGCFEVKILISIKPFFFSLLLQPLRHALISVSDRTADDMATSFLLEEYRRRKGVSIKGKDLVTHLRLLAKCAGEESWSLQAIFAVWKSNNKITCSEADTLFYWSNTGLPFSQNLRRGLGHLSFSAENARDPASHPKCSGSD